MGFPWTNIKGPMIKYVIQTRTEIDTEKRERDQILNFIVVTIGGLAFATALKLSSPPSSASKGPIQATWLQTHPEPIFWIAVTVMTFVLGMFVVRREKLQQIADRWFSLECLLKEAAKSDPDGMKNLLETHVCRQLRAKTAFLRYLRKDFLLVSPLLAIIYTLQLQLTWPKYWPADIALAVISGTAICWLCWKPLEDWTVEKSALAELDN